MSDKENKFEYMVEQHVRFHREHKSIYQLEKADLEGATCTKHIALNGQIYMKLTLKNGTTYPLGEFEIPIILTTYFDGK